MVSRDNPYSTVCCWYGCCYNQSSECVNFRSINILFTLFLVHLILSISFQYSHRLCCHHLSLPQPFTPDLKLICFTNPFLHSLSGSFWIAFTNLNLYRTKWALAFVCFSFFILFLFLVTCARLSWPHSAFESTLNSSVVSYFWQFYHHSLLVFVQEESAGAVQIGIGGEWTAAGAAWSTREEVQRSSEDARSRRSQACCIVVVSSMICDHKVLFTFDYISNSEVTANI